MNTRLFTYSLILYPTVCLHLPSVDGENARIKFICNLRFYRRLFNAASPL